MTNRLFYLQLFLYIITTYHCVTAAKHCKTPLLSRARLSASSEISKDRSANHAVLHGPSAWTAGLSDFGQYLIIDLGEKMNITSIVTQGKPYTSEYVAEFRIEFGYDGQDFAPYRDRFEKGDFLQFLDIDLGTLHNISKLSVQGKGSSDEFMMQFRLMQSNDGVHWVSFFAPGGFEQLFTGNTDGDSVKVNEFSTPIIAQFLRINPTRWKDRISLRLEVYGCDYVSESINFDGATMVTMNLLHRPISSFEDMIRFRFRTNHANGHILYSRGTQKDILSVRLQDNKLVLGLYLGGDAEMNEVTGGSLLDDNLWHDVMITRSYRGIILSVDRVVVRHRIFGDFTRLDLNQELMIGGVKTEYHNEVKTIHNFTGCIENLMLNNTNVVQEIKSDTRSLLYTKYGNVVYSCRFEEIVPITFNAESSHLRLDGFNQPFMNCSFDFRTFNEDGLLMYNKFASSMGHIKVFLDKGKVLAQIQGTESHVVPLDPFPDTRMNNGLWHTVLIVLKTDKIVIEIDGRPSITTRQFNVITGSNYLFGGGLQGSVGFIGCMRYIYVEGRNVNVKSLSSDKIVRTRDNDIVFDSCQMIDRCHPNPCEHGSVCRQNNLDFTCNCTSTGYHGAVCHSSKNPLSCEAHKIESPRTKKAEITIDVDGSGPLDPFPVTCLFLSDDKTQTIIHHKSEGPQTVSGYQEAGSYVRDIKYEADYEHISVLVNRSYSCKQSLRYECHNARLFNTPYSPAVAGYSYASDFKPFSWWVSRNNQQMDYWGGSLPGTRKCSCGLYGLCRDSTKGCNCDSFGPRMQNEKFVDEGDISEKDFLPVRQLRIGDTGTVASSNKWVKYSLGPLVCQGDSMFDRAITFRTVDATVDLASFDMGYSGDIYLQFKTTAESGVLLHSRGAEDFIKLAITSSKVIQFTFSAGSGSKDVTIESSYRFNDNTWHSVMIERNKKEARLIVDNKIVQQRRQTSGPIRAIQLTSNLVIGATVDYREGFVGCVRSLLLNGYFIDMYAVVQAEGTYGVNTGCTGKCQSNPCLHNGTCIERYSSYTCDCQFTSFKGPICADEIGVNLRSDNYIRYDFETSISTLEEFIQVGFTTTEHRGLIFGVSSHTGEYLSLVMSTSGHLRLVFDFGFERQEIIIRNENFALGQHHDVQIRRSDRGSKITIRVDKSEPLVYTFSIKAKADAQFNSLKSIYIGRNESMNSGEGFVGCISRVVFDDHFPLRRLFQENRRSNVKAYPTDDSVREDTCGIESVTHPPEITETRPPGRQSPEDTDTSSSLAGILTVIIVAIAIFLITFLLLSDKVIQWQQKGDYVTREDLGARDALDPDTAVLRSQTGPDISKQKEYFI